MAKNGREFSASVKRSIASRAGEKCSNPECRALTKGPKSDSTGSISVGEAAHIEGEKQDSARFNPLLSDEQCGSIENAIWLCVGCHTKVDRDEEAYPVPLLREWKRGVEAEASAALGKPGGISREALLTQVFNDLVDTARHRHQAKDFLVNYPSLTQKERADLYDKFSYRVDGKSPETNPFKQRCDRCNNEVLGSELIRKEITFNRHSLMNRRGVIPPEDHTERVTICSECASEEKWPAIERKITYEVLESYMNRETKSGRLY